MSAMLRRMVSILAAASLISICVTPAFAEDGRINTLKEMFETLMRCWRPPALPRGHPGMQITVMVAFQRNGEILGKPRITFETPDASQADSLAYRTAVMETLQQCTPLPFTEGLGGAVAGRPLTLRFDDRRNLPKPTEKRAWLIPKIL
jgi:hypothetical protein